MPFMLVPKRLCVTKKPKQRNRPRRDHINTSIISQSAKRTMVASMTPGRSMAMATAILSAAVGVASGEGKMIRVILVARLIYLNA